MSARAGLKFCIVCGLFIQLSIMSASAEILEEVINGQDYLCRPVGVKTGCFVSTDLRLVTAFAIDAVYQQNCRSQLAKFSKSHRPSLEVFASCLAGPQLISYAMDLRYLLVDGDCKEQFVKKCSEVTACRKEGRLGLCGNLGDLLDFLKQEGIENDFTQEEGIKACRSLIDI